MNAFLQCSALFLLALNGASLAVDYHVYRATASLPIVTGDFVNGVDLIVKSRFSTKRLLNLALGVSDREKVPQNLILALLVPVVTPASTPSRLVVFNTETNAVAQTIATSTTITVLTGQPDGMGGVGTGEANVAVLQNPEHDFRFTTPLFGGAKGVRLDQPDGPLLTLELTGLHCRFQSFAPDGFTTQEGIVTKGKIRAAGKPLVTVSL